MQTTGIFLSYSTQDTEAARRTCDALRATGLEVWFDQNELQGGDAWDTAIRKRIKECALFVPIISANTNARSEGYFRLEWKLAVDRSHSMADDQPFLFPVVIDDTPEIMARVPDRFRERQWSRLTDENALDAFAWRLKSILTNSRPTNPAPVETEGSQRVALATLPSSKTASIAVLAFANRSGSADDEYFSDGLADELLNVIAKIRGVRVAARTSAFSFKGKQSTVVEIGRILNVGAVLEGSVRKSGTRVRVAVQLVNVADGYQLWSESFDRTLDDIFAVQDDIAQAVVVQLRTMLVGETSAATSENVAKEIALLTSTRTVFPEAQRLCLQGRFFAEKRTTLDIAHAISLFEQALQVDPTYAQVHSGLGFSYLMMAGFGNGAPIDSLNKARQASHAALRLDTTLAHPHLTLAYYALNVERDIVAWERELDLALKLSPDDPEVLRRDGLRLMFFGNFESARAVFKRAQLLDPLSMMIYINLGSVATFEGKFNEAETNFSRALDIDRSSPFVYSNFAWLAAVRGQHAQSVAFSVKQSELLGDTETAKVMLASFEEGGWHGYLRAMLRRPIWLARSAYLAAQAHLELGQIDESFLILERMLDDHAEIGGPLKIDPLLQSLRGDPRYGALLKRAGFGMNDALMSTNVKL